MKSKLSLLILFLAIFTSCKKTTNVDVKLSTSGQLTYKLTDNDGKGLSNVKVSLLDRHNVYPNLTILLDSRLTDANGQVDFGDLNPNNYLLVADSPKVNNVAYVVEEYVQVITGAVKHKETKVTDYSAKLTLTIKSYNTDQPEKNLGVMLIPSNKFNYSLTASPQLKVADFSGVTDGAGLITFRIPSNKQYTIYFYNTATNTSYTYSHGPYLDKDASANYVMYLHR